jgi:hypothetical protein
MGLSLDEVVAPNMIAMQDPSFSQSRARGRCFLGTLSPSRRQIRWTRSQPTCQPLLLMLEAANADLVSPSA